MGDKGRIIRTYALGTGAGIVIAGSAFVLFKWPCIVLGLLVVAPDLALCVWALLKRVSDSK